MNKQNRVRVMHVAQSAGGVDRYLKMLFKYLDRNSFENILICSESYNIDEYKDIIDHIEIVSMYRDINLSSDFEAVIKIRKKIQQYQPDILYAHSSKAGALARIANLGTGTKCVYNPHGWAFNMHCSEKKRKLYIWIETFLGLLSKKIICISQSERLAAISSKICGEDKLSLIVNGIDINYYEQSERERIKRSSLKIPENAFIVGMVGRLSQQKAPDTFIEVARKIKKCIPNAFFIMVGDGEQRAQVMAYAEKYELSESLVITGWISDPMMYVDLFDVALLLSRWEGFGLVLPEYMMAGKPIVATKVDAIPSIVIDNENGLLVDVDDSEMAFKAVVDLYNDVSLRKNIIENNLRNVRDKYDASRVAKEHEALFNKIVE